MQACREVEKGQPWGGVRAIYCWSDDTSANRNFALADNKTVAAALLCAVLERHFETAIDQVLAVEPRSVGTFRPRLRKSVAQTTVLL